ncbi:MAG: NADH-quinone oxidoreductase subunit NuoK [Thermoanaerobaculia bacterium]
MTVPVSWYLVLAAALFGIGTLGVLSRRSAITMFLSIELMLNSVNLSIVAFARSIGDRTGDLAGVLEGHVLVLMVIAVAAAEAAVGLALFIAVYRRRRTIDVNRLNLMRW